MNNPENPTHLNETENNEALNNEVIPAITAENDGTANTDNPVEEPLALVTDEHSETAELTEEEKELENIDDELPNFSEFNKEQLIQAATDAVKEKDAIEATRILKAIRPVLDHLLQEEHNEALQKFVEEGGTKDDFSFPGDKSRELFNQVSRELKQKKADEKARQEAEKLDNLKKKEAILEQIRLLSETEEDKDSLRKLKDLQSEWKQVRNIPKEHVDRLWESYHLHIHKFYDNLSMFNELKDLDRRKNLDQKIELTKKAAELALEPSTKKVIILLKKYQEEWKSIGPVPIESNEEIWSRFKQECDKIFEMIKSVQAENDRKREENLVSKKELLVKALELSNLHSTRIKEWLEQSTVANQLMEDWKKIGMVPIKFRESLWEEFRTARNQFYNNKNEFFKKLHAERNNNLKIKTELCEKAEAISSNPIDLNKQTDELKKLQEQWKKIGPVHEKISDAIWKRFRTACDSFFEKKAAHYADQVQEQQKNLEVKQGLLQQLETLLAREDGANIINDLKALQEQWNQAGFVPMSAKEAINKKYSETTDQVFNKFKQANAAMRDMKDRSHLEALFNSPNGDQKIKREERFIQDKIRGLKSDIDTWDNNLGFFAKSKGENPMVEQIKEKINAAHRQIKNMEEKLKLVRQIVRQEQKS